MDPYRESNPFEAQDGSLAQTSHRSRQSFSKAPLFLALCLLGVAVVYFAGTLDERDTRLTRTADELQHTQSLLETPAQKPVHKAIMDKINAVEQSLSANRAQKMPTETMLNAIYTAYSQIFTKLETGGAKEDTKKIIGGDSFFFEKTDHDNGNIDLDRGNIPGGEATQNMDKPPAGVLQTLAKVTPALCSEISNKCNCDEPWVNEAGCENDDGSTCNVECCCKYRPPLWVALPFPTDPMTPLEPEEWSKRPSPSRYVEHNILGNAEKTWDTGFQVHYVATPTMKKKCSHTTNEERHQAIVGCSFAFGQFMNENLPEEEWWLADGLLIGAWRDSKFIPWDEDGDMAVTDEAWHSVKKLLKRKKAPGLPAQLEGCQCVLLDTASFGSVRPSTSLGAAGFNGIPGRVINTCTGNYVDLFVVKQTAPGSGSWLMSVETEKPMRDCFHNSSLFPLQPCKLDGLEFKCPKDPAAHLAAFPYATPPKSPDHVWNEDQKDWVALTPKF